MATRFHECPHCKRNKASLSLEDLEVASVKVLPFYKDLRLET